MTGLSNEQRQGLAQMMGDRKDQLLGEIRSVLTASEDQQYRDLAGAVADTGDEAVADLLTDIDNAEVTRDLKEIRDIDAALGRMAAGRFGVCSECGGEIDYQRLLAYPTAKRCFVCQQHHEKTYAGRKAGPTL